MKNINNNLIFTLGILGVVVLNLVFISPNQADAYLTQGAYIYCDGTCDGSDTIDTPTTSTNVSNPTIYSLSPSQAEVNNKTKTVSVLGTGFRPDSIARWNASDRPTSYINSGKLVMELDPSDTAVPGKYLVTVVNPSPEGGKFSNPKVFTVANSNYTNTGGTVAGATTTGGSVVNGGYKAPITKKVATKKTTVKTNQAKVAVAETDTCLATTTGSINDSDSTNNSSFSASALNGGNSFMPSTVIGWLMLFVLVFLSVLLFRKLWITEADKNTPLKHA
jgi:hypothetical protein